MSPKVTLNDQYRMVTLMHSNIDIVLNDLGNGGQFRVVMCSS
jgi:hypothetical protein